jgi:hypothetical protein
MEPVLRDDERADLAEVFPHHVQGAADEFAVDLGDDELLHRRVERDDLLAEKDPSLHPGLEQGQDAADVRGPRRPDDRADGLEPSAVGKGHRPLYCPLRWSREGLRRECVARLCRDGVAADAAVVAVGGVGPLRRVRGCRRVAAPGVEGWPRTP